VLLSASCKRLFRLSSAHREYFRLNSQSVCKMTQGEINTDRILSAGQHALYTDSVQIVKPIKQRHRKQPPLEEQKSHTIQVVTSSTPDIMEPAEKNGLISHTQINIQPLMILDLNGILCHRIRRRPNQDPPIISEYRSQLGPKVAHTPIIPRPDLLHFLEFVDRHFCLAVWTSAKPKTAKKLVDLLIPKSIKDRLLFVWSQGQCLVDESPSNSESKETIFIKDLDLVWQKFPLWNQYNTILMDDSPEKCARWKENALHPPPLHGRKQKRADEPEDSARVWISDEENVRQQFEFLTLFTAHWTSCPVTKVWESNIDHDGARSVVNNANDGMSTFLVKHATEFMGWKS
jgi:NLI interacting factor-like phosphatase